MFKDFTKYEIFDDGRIWSYSHNKWLKPNLRPDGYLSITLSDNDGKIKKYRIHRVVYEAVTGQPIPEGMQVNHIDENKTNNHISNLNLMTCKENINWGTRNERVGKANAKANTNNPITSKQVAQYDKEENLINIYPSLMEVHRQLGFNFRNISKCCNGKRKTCNGFIWKYITENPSITRGFYYTKSILSLGSA